MRIVAICFLSLTVWAQEGTWKGAISIPGNPLEIWVTLKDGDTWSGTIAIPAQGIHDYALADISIDGGNVGFLMPGVPGEPRFAGVMKEGRIVGTFHQGPQVLDFHLDSSDTPPPQRPSMNLPDTPVTGTGAVGHWIGQLEAGPIKLRLALEISQGESDLTGVMDSMDQNAKLKMNDIKLDGDHFSFAIGQVNGSYTGVMKSDGSAIEGTWTQMGNSSPLVFHRLNEAPK
ncbi:MAG: hypothetical protein KDC35_10475 [Acidobacteria bacterium]|nr:hypothetical protein [Acidobacteriota bacterium]